MPVGLGGRDPPEHARQGPGRDKGTRDMLWDIRALMKPALSVIDLIPNVHRTPTLAMLRRAVQDGRPLSMRLSADDKELAFLDAHVAMTSPIGAKILKSLYMGGHLKLKKPAQKSLPALDAYIATEAAFRAEVARILAADAAKRDRLAEIIANPECAVAAELTPWLIDRVISAHRGHGAVGSLRIAGLDCHRVARQPAELDDSPHRAGSDMMCWWIDHSGQRQGDAGPAMPELGGKHSSVPGPAG